MMDIYSSLDSAAPGFLGGVSHVGTAVMSSGTPFSLANTPAGFTGAPESPETRQTLWMGDLDPWMDENFVKQVWYNLGEQVNVKLIRDKFTGQSAGYCFVEFMSNQAATKALLSLNGSPIPASNNKIFKLNWATGAGVHERREYQGPEYSIFVGDLGPEVNDYLLASTFQQRYPSCRSAKVVTDPVTGLSRGYGFVRFGDESEQQRSMVEMQGMYCGSRPMRISVATPKHRAGANWSVPQANWALNTAQIYHDPSNTTVFVGGLVSGYVSEDDLLTAFAPFGPISYVKIPPGKGCGFVSYVHRASAEQAIAQLNGCIINGNRIRLSWGRNSAVGLPAMPPMPIANGAGPGVESVGAQWKNFNGSPGYFFGSSSMPPTQSPSPDKFLTSDAMSMNGGIGAIGSAGLKTAAFGTSMSLTEPSVSPTTTESMSSDTLLWKADSLFGGFGQDPLQSLRGSAVSRSAFTSSPKLFSPTETMPPGSTPFSFSGFAQSEGVKSTMRSNGTSTASSNTSSTTTTVQNASSYGFRAEVWG